MNSSVWGYLFLVLGLSGIVLINVFGQVTINNEQDYYSLKEVTESAMIDAVDEDAMLMGVGYDGVTQLTDRESMHCDAGIPGTVRILKERFVELFIVKFADSVNVDNNYTIVFRDIDECPPKVTVEVTVSQSYSYLQKVMGLDEEKTMSSSDIVNVINGILESGDPSL